VREGCNVKLWPTPDDVYTITIKYNTVLEDLSDDNASSNLPHQWDEIILYGAVWRGWIKLGDTEKAKEIKGFWTSLFSGLKPVESKEEVDTHYAALNAMRPDYDV
jgi:hypothetical protein